MPCRSTIVVLLLLASCGSSGAGTDAGTSDASNDATTARRIELVGMLEVTGLPIHDVWEYTEESSGDRYALLCASDAGLKVIALSDPSNPVEVGSVGGGVVAATDVKTWKSYAYIIGEGVGGVGNIIDLSNPASPALVGTFPAAHNIFIDDTGYMYLAAPGLRIYDLNPNPLVPAEVYNDPACVGHDISIIGNRLFDFSGDCGTRIYDLADPGSPTLLGTVVDNSFSHHSGWTSSDGTHLYICDELAPPDRDDIAVWDIRDLGAPVRVGGFADPDAYVHNLYVVGDYAYVSYYRAGFRVFDVSDPSLLSLADEYDTDPQASGPGFGGNFGVYPFTADGSILASDEENGLFVFSFGEL